MGKKKKRFLILGIILVVVLAVLVFAAWPYVKRHYFPVKVDRKAATQMTQVDFGDKKVMTVYFTRVGNSDFAEDVDAVSSASLMEEDGELIGNSQLLAEMIRNAAGGDLYAIQTVKKYPSGYGDTTEEALRELRSNETVELSGELPELAGTDILFLVYPIWWNTIPKAVETFLDSTDTAGVTVYPLITHGGSRQGNCMADMKAAVSEMTISDNFLTVYDDEAVRAKEQVQKWLESCR